MGVLFALRSDDQHCSISKMTNAIIAGITVTYFVMLSAMRSDKHCIISKITNCIISKITNVIITGTTVIYCGNAFYSEGVTNIVSFLNNKYDHSWDCGHVFWK